MKIIGLIAEYNPFHNGHLEQLKQIQERYGERLGLIAVMSGDWTQRAGLAVLDKWDRARLATAAGINLVLELPTLFATGNGQCFASGAVHLLAATGLVKNICCGAETEQPKFLHTAADLMLNEPPELSLHLQTAFKNGMNPGAAWENAIKAYMQSIPENDIDRSADQDKQAFPPDLLTGSNNWLAIEYIKAAKSLGNAGPRITILRRRGQAYLDDQATGESTGKLLSATAVRTALYHLFGYPTESSNWNTELWNKLCHSLPDYTAGTLLRAGLNKTMGFNEQIGPYILATLLAVPKSYLTTLAGFSTDFSNRLIKTANQLVDLPPTAVWQQLIEAVTSRNFTAAHTIRSLTALALGITQKQRDLAIQEGPQYIRVLAFDKTGRYLLRRMRDRSRLPIITKESDFLEYNHLGTVFAQQYKTDIKASRIRRLLTGQGPGNNFDTRVHVR
ncbi:MAG: nucleotidyltransferase family protein [Fastidiosipilaceae bacterium]|jgi:predicted nucleotidyltransferase|nr:nucleotidyltransferase family protein [Clostridiaceae bacterium]